MAHATSLARVLRGAGLALGGSVAVGVLTVQAVGGQYERQLGKACFDRRVEQAERMLIGQGEASYKRVARADERLAAAEARDEGSAAWEFALVQSEESRVLALPGGYAILHSGMLDTLDDTAIAFLLARERARAKESGGLLSRALALAHAAAPWAQPVLDLAESLRPSSAQLLRAERGALRLLAAACFDPSDAPPRLRAIERACGGAEAAEAAGRRAEALESDVPAALVHAAAALLALVPAEGRADDSALRSLLSTRADRLLTTLVDRGSDEGGGEEAQGLLLAAATVMERLAADERCHPWLLRPQLVSALLTAACSPHPPPAERACGALAALAAGAGGARAFGAAERSILRGIGEDAPSPAAAALAQQAEASLRQAADAARASAMQRQASARARSEATERAIEKLRARDAEREQRNSTRRRLVDWFGPLTRRKRAVAEAEAAEKAAA